MKKAICPALALGFLSSVHLASCAEPPRYFSPTGQILSAQETAEQLQREKKEAAEANWNVAVDVQILAVPQDVALPLLPDLQSSDEAKVDAAIVQLQDLLKRRQARLLG